MITFTPIVPFRGRSISIPWKKYLLLSVLSLFASVYLSAQCTATVAVQPGVSTCNGQPFNLVLTSATGTSPFDLTINGTTYNDVSIGGVINFDPSKRIWPALPAPLPPTELDAAVTLGVKFRSSVAGFVRGVRFISPTDASTVPGNYTGQLWSQNGNLLASGTFVNVTASQWQELIFDDPVLIAANTVYVASYHTKDNSYVTTIGGLAADFTPPGSPLTALGNGGAAGTNGVFAYGATPSFPGNSDNTDVAQNYWADVIFSPSAIVLESVSDAAPSTCTGTPQTIITAVDCSTLPVNIVVTPQVTATAVTQTFNVTVSADFVGSTTPEVDNVEVHLSFDKNKLQVTNIDVRPPLSPFTEDIPIEAAPYTTTNTNGQINYKATRASGGLTADFEILTITFSVIGGAGTTTPLTLLTAPANQTGAAENGISVLSSVVDGTVTINAAGCAVLPTATISAPGGATSCNFNLLLDAASNGTAPFDLTIAGPGGTFTYNDIPVGGVITNFTPADERIWPATPSPLPVNQTDVPITLGVKFSSSVSGFVKGVRFFSPGTIDATFTGQLWSEGGGSPLAQGTFSTVTATDWQELTFATPVEITAGTTYIASYHTTGTQYRSTEDGLMNAVSNGSLTASSSVYSKAATVTFPTTASVDNYWADVIFTPNVYTFNLLSVTDAAGCSNTASTLQTLNVTSAECNVVLPVSLVNFSAIPKEQSVYLEWSTASENNSKGFDIERSIDSNTWSVIGFVNGAGNSSATLHYSYTDGGLAPGRYFYRLKQVDLDGRYEYSTVVSAEIGSGTVAFTLEQNFPNPFSNKTVVRFTLPQKATVNLSIFDMHGRLVKVVVNEAKDAGTHSVNVHADALSSGLYYYRLQAGDFSAVKKMTIQ